MRFQKVIVNEAKNGAAAASKGSANIAEI